MRNKIDENFIVNFSDIPDNLKQTLSGKRFFLYDSGIEDEERILIFSSDFQIEYLNKSETWLIDGTFKSCPREFNQLFTVNFCLFGKVFPAIFVLMLSQSMKSYEKVFEILKKKNIKKCPKYIISDFEKSIISACKSSFKTTSHYGCSFHFGQLMWRKINALGLTTTYKENMYFRRIIRMILNLTFVTIDRVLKFYDYIKQLILNEGHENLFKVFYNSLREII
jgi:hypothetical protein